MGRSSFRLTAGSLIVVLVVLFAVLSYSQRGLDLLGIKGFTLLQDPEEAFVAGGMFSRDHIFGLDMIGRDLFSRVAFSMKTFIEASAIALSIALSGGIIAGTIEAMLDNTFVIDLSGVRLFRIGGIIGGLNKVVASMPQIVVIVLLWKLFGEMSIYHIMTAFGIFTIPRISEKVRSKILAIRNEGFVESARALGLGPWRILGKHILWHQMRYLLLVETAYITAEVVLFETGISFLGYGAGDISLGTMAAQGKEHFISELTAMNNAPMTEVIRGFIMNVTLWSTFTLPGLAIIGTLLGFYLLADGLKERLVRS